MATRGAADGLRVAGEILETYRARLAILGFGLTVLESRVIINLGLGWKDLGRISHEPR